MTPRHEADTETRRRCLGESKTVEEDVEARRRNSMGDGTTWHVARIFLREKLEWLELM